MATRKFSDDDDDAPPRGMNFLRNPNSIANFPESARLRSVMRQARGLTPVQRKRLVRDISIFILKQNGLNNRMICELFNLKVSRVKVIIAKMATLRHIRVDRDFDDED